MPRVEREELQGHVEELARAPRHSLHHSEGHSRAASYISEAFRCSGLEVTQHAFDGAGRPGANIVGRKAGTDPSLPAIAVTAHYDTVPGSPGADDNASGVAALLETARLLGGASLQRTVELVAFDMEEIQPDGTSLVGSTAFVGSLTDERSYLGVYNLETIGYTSGPNTQSYPPGFGIIFPGVFGQVQRRDFRGDFIAVVSRGPGKELACSLQEAALKCSPELAMVHIEAPSRFPLLPDVFRSDHASFWAAGIPAVMLTDTANFRNPNYHQPSDTAPTLDLDFLTAVTQALLGAVTRYAEAPFEG